MAARACCCCMASRRSPTPGAYHAGSGRCGILCRCPDSRGYGRTTGWPVTYDEDLSPWRPINLAETLLAWSIPRLPVVAAVIGHDFGSPSPPGRR